MLAVVMVTALLYTCLAALEKASQIDKGLFTLVTFVGVNTNVCRVLFTNLVRWHASAISFPLSDIILAQLACPLSDVMFCL